MRFANAFCDQTLQLLPRFIDCFPTSITLINEHSDSCHYDVSKAVEKTGWWLYIVTAFRIKYADNVSEPVSIT